MFELPGKVALALREVPSRAPLAAVVQLRGSGHAWLLESALPSARLGRFHFAGADPYLVLRAWGRRVLLECRRAVAPGLRRGRRVVRADPLDLARALLPRTRPEADFLPFVGGAVGALGYELAAQLETLPAGGVDDLGLPDLTLLFVDRVLAIEARSGRTFACGLGFGDAASEARDRAGQAVASLLSQLAAERSHGALPFRAAPRRAAPLLAGFDESTYTKAVRAILDEIAEGNVYQACLTQRMERHFGADPLVAYTRLRELNPAPFASYLELPDATLVGSSPERFLRLRPGGEIESRPIKGTRPRGATPKADRALREELARSPKERAENLMIVDLVRNDLGRVCEIGSVGVPERMAIESYANVFQMVSTVRGRLRSDCDVFDAIRAGFPAGSMTGAPKIAAMKLLARLEPVRRGLYAGAVGYLDARGGADLSVVIRTILLRQGRAIVHAGGGIVADSDPAAEYRESLDKAAPLLAALDAAERQPEPPDGGAAPSAGG